MKFERYHEVNGNSYGVNRDEKLDCSIITKIEGNPERRCSYQQVAKLYKTGKSKQFVLSVIKTIGHYTFGVQIDRPMLVIENWYPKRAEEKSCRFLDDLLQD